jgi:glutaredoxin 3
MANDTRIRMYTTPTCGFCQAARRLLTNRGVPFEEIDVSDPARRAEAQREHDWPTVPIVLVDGELVGGYTELEALDRREGLDHLRAAQ